MGLRSATRRAVRTTQRTALIWWCVIKQLFRVANLRRKYVRRASDDPEVVAARAAAAAKLRDTMLHLGPTFIKLGQLLSTRVDVLPPEVIKELAVMQNEVPGFGAKRAMAVIEESLGKPPSELFATFDEEHIAAASLAQVHRATLHSGEEVVVKVQRENLRELFDVDLMNIRLVARLADRLDPATEGVASNWKGIAETSGTVLYREIDFNHERESGDTFRKNFEKDSKIKVPKMVPELCSDRVLTMEYAAIRG